MSDKSLKRRYGRSDGTDAVAEEELRRRGLTDRQIKGVIYGYSKGEYEPRRLQGKAPRMLPRTKTTPLNQTPAVNPAPTENQGPRDAASQPEPAAAKVRFMYSGPFKGLRLTDVPQWYLEWQYGSFSKGRKHIEKELRSRGCGDKELKQCRKNYPSLGKYPKKRAPKNKFSRRRSDWGTESGPSGP